MSFFLIGMIARVCCCFLQPVVSILALWLVLKREMCLYKVSQMFEDQCTNMILIG